MLRRLRRNESGVALALVIGLVAVLMLFVMVALESATRSSRDAHRDADYVAALPAAQAGVEAYLYRLNVDNNYFTKGNDTSNPAFTGWVNIPGASNRGQYRYEVVSTIADSLSKGIVRLRASGRVGERVRTIDVTIRKSGFLDYLYYTDKETTDPARYPELYAASDVEAKAQCDRYYPGRGSVAVPLKVNSTGRKPCEDIQFRTADVLDGPVGSNDAFLLSGKPTFTANVDTHWNDPNKRYWRAAKDYSSDSPVFASAPVYSSYKNLPPGNADIKAQTDRSTGAKGCLYTGPTLLRFIDSGQYEVTSPYTKQTGAGCGTGLADWQQEGKPIKHAKKDTVSLPANGVIFVQSIPGTGPNYDEVNGASCPVPVLEDKLPDADEYFPLSGGGRYDCRAGDAWVQGKVRGQLTVAAANDIYVTGDLTYDTSQQDNVLGLVASQNVKVYHPVKCTDVKDGDDNKDTPKDRYCSAASNLRGTNQDITIEAAILALNHSFGVQNYNVEEELGTLRVRGSIAQKFRGAVGTFRPTGYAKDYVYDERLRYLQPPFFLTPTETSWSVRSFSEQRPAYTP